VVEIMYSASIFELQATLCMLVFVVKTVWRMSYFLGGNAYVLDLCKNFALLCDILRALCVKARFLKLLY